MRSFRNIFPFFLSSKKIYAFIRTLPLLKIIGDNYLSIWAYDKLVLDEIKKNEATDAENRSNSTVEQRKRSLDRLFRAACSWTGDNNSAAKIREQKARGNRKKKGKYLCTLQRERERRERKEKKKQTWRKGCFQPNEKHWREERTIVLMPRIRYNVQLMARVYVKRRWNICSQGAKKREVHSFLHLRYVCFRSISRVNCNFSSSFFIFRVVLVSILKGISPRV